MAKRTTRTASLGLAAAGLALATAFAGPAFAQGAPAQGQPQVQAQAGQGAQAPARMGRGGPRGGLDLAAMDTNADGTISAEERRAFATARAAALDTDGDGRITRAEFEAHAAAEAGRRAAQAAGSMFDTLDADSDGVLTAAEALAGGGKTRMLSRLDQNGDGDISAEEMRQMRRQMREQMRGERGEREGREGHDGQRQMPRWMQRG